MTRGRRVRIAPGVYRDGIGISSTVKVGDLPQREKRFPSDTKLKTIRGWQDETRVSLRQLAPTYVRGTLTSDVRDYLSKTKPTHIDARAYKQRVREIEAWLPRFGARLRQTLTSQELNAQLWDWRKMKSAKTCNHRRTALGHLFVVLDGKSAKNVVRDTVKFEPPDPTPKALPLDVIDRVLDELPTDSRTQARLRLMRWTGMRPSQIHRLTRASFQLEAPVPHVVVPRGKKGRVVRVPFVSPASKKVAKTFVRLCLEEPAHKGKSIGRISTESANRLLKDACEAASVPIFTLYRIKHSVGSRLREVMDLADVQAVYGHMNATTTEIYAAPVEAKILLGFKHLTVRQPRKKSA